MRVVELLIDLAVCHKLFMGPLFENATFFDNGYFVGVLNGRKPMGDNNGRSALTKLVKRALNGDLGRVVKSACRFVENEDGGVFKEYPGDTYPLLCPPESLTPRSPICESKPLGNVMT